MKKDKQKDWEDNLESQLKNAEVNPNKDESAGIGIGEQLKLNQMEVVDEEIVSNDDSVEVTVKEDKFPSMKNIPYVKMVDYEGRVINPLGGFYPNYFKNRRERRASWRAENKNPKNNKKGARVVVTKIGNLSFTKAYPQLQTIEASKKPVLDDSYNVAYWKRNKRRTIVHNQIKSN